MLSIGSVFSNSFGEFQEFIIISNVIIVTNLEIVCIIGQIISK